MTILPPSTNADYRGSTISVAFLAFTALFTIGPAFVHYFLPDGGAGVIAGMDLSMNGDVVIATFAWMGATQTAYGLILLAIAVYYRPLTALALSAELVHRLMSAAAAWGFKASANGHHPPEHYATLINIPLLILFIWLATRPRQALVHAAPGGGMPA